MAIVVGFAIALSCNLVVLRGGRSDVELRHAQAIVVLGAGVRGDAPSDVLRDRLETALALFRAGRAPKLLLTGDHGRVDYDEVGTMKRWLSQHGVPDGAMVLDHAGFDTYSSIVRAHDVFGVDRAIVVTQQFHLPRALWIARSVGIDAEGVAADRREYVGATWFQLREVLSRTKAWLDVAVGRKPRFSA